MAVKTIPFRVIEERSKDIYEAVMVVARRASQIIGDRAAEMQMAEGEQAEPEVMAEPSPPKPDYVEKEKPVTIAIQEFLQGDLEWNHPTQEQKDE